jgi:hypothetical protein
MPCDTIQLNRVELGAMDASLLHAALDALGATDVHEANGLVTFRLRGVVCQIRAGELTVQEGYESLADTIKVAYSEQVIQYTAGVLGAELERVGEHEYELRLRR